MSAHFNALTGQFLLSEQLVHAGKNQFYDLQNGNIVFGDLLVPKLGNTLFDGATLDLNFANDKSLTDRVSGDNLVTFTRASSGTYVDADGLIKSATNNTPRFDHDPATGESLGLLIEESRTNLLTYSEELDNAVWAVQGTPTLTASSQLAPDGSLTAWDFTRPDGGGHFIFQQKTGLNTSATYTYSLYVKVASGTADFQLLAFDTATRSSSVFTATTEWQRFDFTVQPTATTANFYLADPESSAYGTALTVWGAQLEEGPYGPTSYIPTSGSTVTRAADVAEITGTNFSSWYNQTEGTVFVEGDGDGPRLVGFNDGTDSNRHELFLSTANVTLFQKTAGVNEVNILSSISTKSAFTYKLNNYALSTGGNSVVTDTSATPPTVDKMSIGNWYNSTGQLNGHIKRLAYFPVRKTDEELQELTS